MKKNLLFALLIIFFGNSFAQTSVPGGAVSGTWNLAGSPYQIQGSIQIPNGSTLTIEPGVTVIFQSNYQFQVNGRLLAIGTQTDSITFTAANTSIGWNSIRFPSTANTNDTSKIIFCKLLYGKATGTSSLANGGALNFTNFSKAIVSNCRISNCLANNYGGGIYCSSSSPIISHNIIINNTSSGIYFDGTGVSSAYISFNIITNNTTNADGGGIYCSNTSNSIISNNTVSGNQADDAGGGIYLINNTSPIIFNNIISNNSSGIFLGAGGGIMSYLNTNTTISNNNITNNSSINGAGLYLQDQTITTLTNNVIVNNSTVVSPFGGSGGFGGGIQCGGGNPILINNTISNNSAKRGGALYCNGSSNPTLRNCILWGNTASDVLGGNQVYLFDEPSDPSFYYCDVQGGTAAFELNGNFFTGNYQNNINVSPQFVSPSAGSGSGFNGVTANWSLQVSSPCIDTGDPSYSPYPSTDIAGNPRVVICRIDMGAYEYQSGVPIVASISAGGNTTFCEGGSVTLTSGSSVNNLWSPNGETTQSINVNESGSYSVTVTDGGCSATSETTTVTVNTNPSVSFSGPEGGYCSNAPSVELFGSPSGGTFNGPGISGNYFDPSLANIGINTINYTYTDNNGCTGTSTDRYVNIVESPVASFTFVNNDPAIDFTETASNEVSYDWDFGDGSPNSNDPNPSHSFTIDGTYDVTLCVTSSGGCQDCEMQSVTILTTGLIDDIVDNFNIYPNPTSSSLTVEKLISEATSIQTEIKNTIGQVIYSFSDKVNKGLYKKTIDLNLASGVYFLTLKTNEDLLTKKIEVVK